MLSPPSIDYNSTNVCFQDYETGKPKSLSILNESNNKKAEQ